MKGSLRLGRVFGINVLVHWSFLLIIAWAVYVGWSRGGTLESVMWTTAFVLSIFACVVLHEFGHALTAKRYGIDTKRITLLPIGGVASLDRIPEDPKQELLVAVMGPAVNVVIAGLLYFFVNDQFGIFQDTEAAAEFLKTITPENFLLYLFFTNVVLVVFNVIPAFPMDGGRVLRALLAFRMDRVRATQIAANLGQIIAILFFFYGIFYNIFLVFIALFVFFGASGEYMMVRQVSILRGHRVHEAMMSNYTVFEPTDTLETVGKTLLSGSENNFVVAQQRVVIGVLLKNRIVEAYQSKRSGITVGDIMERNFTALQPADDLSEAYRTVQSRNINFFPVLDNGQLAGVIDMENINEFIMMQAALEY